MQRTSEHRHHRFQTLIIVATIGAALLQFGTAIGQTAKPDIIVYICESTTADSRAWRNTLGSSIARALAQKERTRISVRGEAQCGDSRVEIACMAGIYDQGGRIVACSPDTLVNLLKVSAWYVAEQSAMPDDDYEQFRLRHPKQLGYSALSTVSSSNIPPSVSQRIDALRQDAEAQRKAKSSEQLVFEGIADLVFSAIIGHESSHMESGPPYCAIENSSRVEESGLWKVLQRTATGDELYKPQNPELGEIRADRCATRRIRSAIDTLDKSELSPKQREFARRAAADIVATILLIRFSSDGSPSVFAPVNDSYLYPPLRIIALVGEMGLGQSSAPTICGGAAENLTAAIEQTFKQRPGNGILPDEIEKLLPKGVIDAWNQNAKWSPASYACL